MTPQRFLTIIEVVTIHDILIDEFGGSHGIRDMGALESAVFRPMSLYYEDALAEAAALLESLAVNHPFVDGNKRVAVAAADIHLRMNGWALDIDSVEAHFFLMDLFDAGAFEMEHLERWVRENVVALRGR